MIDGPHFDPLPLIGRNLGSVELIGHIGCSSNAHVFRGRHTTMDMEVAVKIVRLPAVISDIREAFLRRAAAAGRISHTNVIQVYDVGTTDDGYTWLFMQLADRGSLAGRIEQRGPLRLVDFLSLKASGLNKRM